MPEDRLEELFHEILDLPAGEREDRLDAIRRTESGYSSELRALIDAFEASPRFLAPADAANPDSPPPALLGRYPIEREIGRGGMGIVYLARDPDLEREVAVKILPGGVLGSDRLGKLRAEARVLASVNHPNVAAVHSIEEVASPGGGSCAILTMEYVPGTTLAEGLRAGPLPLEQALDCGRQLAAALEAAHARSVVHRDLKPQNIRLAPEGWVKVLDFGLARVVLETGAGESSFPDTRRRFAAAGTPGYMSPEQCRGEVVDVRSDLWSFGAVLYECLAGEPAIRGADPPALFEANGRGDASLDALPPSVPQAVEELLRSCLQPLPDRRPSSAAEARRTLEEALLRLRAGQLLGLPCSAAVQGGAVPSAKGNLPHPWSSFVGRTAELERLESAFASSSLVTLSGPGGVGKTRMAQEFAARVESGYTGGVWFIDLAKITGGAEVPAAVLRTMRSIPAGPSGGSTEPHRAVLEVLRGERGLLIFDNCEHVVADVAGFVQLLLATPSGVRILATSRQALDLPGERVIPIPPLATAPGSPAEPQGEAVRLFVDRARGRVPGIAFDGGALAVAERICRRLDGLPLAIELAAGQVRNLSLDELLSRIEAGRPLAAHSPALPERHRSLENVVGWSFELLTPKAQALLRRLSVFRGGCTLASAEAVCAGWGGIEEWEIYDLLAGLINRSLVDPDLPGSAPGTAGAPTRYRLLETVRSYAGARLRGNAEEEEALRDRFLCHLRAVAAIRDEERTPHRSSWAARLAPEQANLLHGLGVALEAKRLGDAFAVAVPLGHGWIQTGEWLDGTRWMDRLLAARGGEGRIAASDRAAEVCVLSQAGLLAAIRSLPEKAQPIIDAALSCGEALGEPEPLAQAHEAAGTAAWRQGRLEEAERHLSEARRCFAEAGDRGGVAVTTGNLGTLQCTRGNLEPASALYLESLRLAREMEDAPAAAAALANLGYVAGAQGRFEDAASRFEEAIAIYRAARDMPALAMVLQNLGQFQIAAGKLEQARLHLRESARIRLRQGDRSGLHASIVLLGRLADREGHGLCAAEILGWILLEVETGSFQCRPDTKSMLAGWREELTRRLGESEMTAALARGMGRDLAALLLLADPGPGGLGEAEGGPEA